MTAHEPDALQRQALRTWKDKDAPLREQQIHALLGLAGETGELTDLLKKHFYKPDREATPEMVKDELSDVLYYVAVLSHLWGFTFDDMAEHLAAKLSDGHGWTQGEPLDAGVLNPKTLEDTISEAIQMVNATFGLSASAALKEIMAAGQPLSFSFQVRSQSGEEEE